MNMHECEAIFSKKKNNIEKHRITLKFTFTRCTHKRALVLPQSNQKHSNCEPRTAFYFEISKKVIQSDS